MRYCDNNELCRPLFSLWYIQYNVLCDPLLSPWYIQYNVLCLYDVLQGTFGQPDQWDIYNPQTFQHPMVPYDILVDPLSLPSHPVISEREHVVDVLYDKKRTMDNDRDIDSKEVRVIIQQCRDIDSKEVTVFIQE